MEVPKLITKPCLQCGHSLTKGQKFCSNCAWKVDQSIFEQEGLTCKGVNQNGVVCGQKLLPCAKFCPECATPVQHGDVAVTVLNNPIGKTEKQNNSPVGTGDGEKQQDSDISAKPMQPSTTEEHIIHEKDISKEENYSKTQHKKTLDKAFTEEQKVNEVVTTLVQTISNTLNEQLVDILPIPIQATPHNDVSTEKVKQETEVQNTRDTTANDNQSYITEQQRRQLSVDNEPPLNKSVAANRSDNSNDYSLPFPKEKNSDDEVDKRSKELEPSDKELERTTADENKSCSAMTSSKTSQVDTESNLTDNPTADESKDGKTATTEHAPPVDNNQQQVEPVFGASKKTDAKDEAEKSERHSSSDRFSDSFIFGSNRAGTSGPDKNKDEPMEDVSAVNGDNPDRKTDTGKESQSQTGENQEMSEDGSSDSSASNSDSEPSEGDSNLNLKQKRKKDKRKNKKIKEDKKRERKKRKQKREDGKDGQQESENISKQEDIKNKNGNSLEPTGQNEASGSQTYTRSSTQTFAEVTSGTNTSSSQKVTENRHKTFIDVCFHVLISPTILSNPEKDYVVVAFEKYDGGWESKKRKLSMERPRADKFIVASVTVPIPKHMLHPGPFYYNYRVYYGDSQNSSTWEYFYHSGQMNEMGFFRNLSVPQKHISKGLYNCYDGVVREDPRPEKKKSRWEVFKDSVSNFFKIDAFHKQLCRDAELSISAFLPTWHLTLHGINGEEMISQITCIEEGIRKVYLKDVGLWYAGGSGFDQCFGSILLTHIKGQVHHLSEGSKNRLSAEAKTLQLVTALTITYLVSEFNIELDSKDKRLLCEVLLPSPDFEKKISPDVDDLKNYFPTVIGKVAEHVLKFSRCIASKSSDPSWMFCVPIIHFLHGKCKPFEEASRKVDHNASSPEWWGTVEYGNGIDQFKRQTKWDRSADEVVKKLTPYFGMDYFLPRTLLASLKLESLHDIVVANRIPPEISIASSFYYLKENRNLDLVRKIILHVASQCLDEDPDVSKAGLTSAWRLLKISADLLEESLKFLGGNNKIHLPAIQVFLIALDEFDKIQDKLDLNRNELSKLSISKDAHLQILENFRGRIAHWLLEEPYYKHELAYLKLWNAALTIKIPDGKIKDSYVKYLEDRLQNTLHKQGDDERLIEIYCEYTEKFDEVVQEILSKIALKAANNCVSVNWRSFKGDKSVLKLGELLSSVFERSWDMTKLDNPHQALHHCVTWGPFPTYIEMFCNNPENLSGTCQKQLKSFVKTVSDTIQKLVQGDILIKDLKVLSSKRENFQKVIVAMKQENTDAIMQTLAVRTKEFETFEKTYQIVQQFTYCSLQCKADTSVLDIKLKAFNATDMVCLNQLVKTVFLNDLKDADKYRPTVKVFELSSEELEILPNILQCCQGFLFSKIWEKIGTEHERKTGKKVQIQEIFEKVWNPALEKWKSLCKMLKNGDMLFSEFDKWFKMRDSSDLKREFLLFDSDGDNAWIDDRIDQIKKYRDLKNCAYGAQAIMEVVNAFDLKGDFSLIQEIVELTGGADTRINKLDHSLLDTCSILKKVTKERAECLKAFIRCKPLVDWLKESMSAGLKELKVFVDLASISAGEGDMEIAKVNCLHSATTGYAPLIFNLEKQCNTKIFLERCEEVWKELAANPELPKKLVDTNRQLEWLKSVKQSHGSVEVTSLAQAEAINAKGQYQVGNLRKKAFLKNPVLTDVLELRVPEEEGSVVRRNHYRYEQLLDLQSRLMLVAGKAEKGNDDVDRFMLILDSIVRLGSIYTKLVAEGCVLFSQWHVKFFCDKERKACAVMHFGFGDDRHTLKGRIDEENEDVSIIIQKIARFLEQCHEKWLDYIDKIREKYYCLNFFTIDQMVILQQELVKLGSTQEPSVLIYPLLSAVQKDCTKEDLVRAMSFAKSDVDRLDMEQQISVEAKVCDEGTPKTEEPVLNVKKFIEEMIKAGYSLDLANEALNYIEPDDIDGGLVWCMDNEDDFEPMEMDHQSTETQDEELSQTRFTGWTQSCQSLSSMTGDLVNQLDVGIGENTIMKLTDALGELWESFLTSISSSVSDYLSVEHLGMILNRLTEQETFAAERTFLPCFTAGQPNLIICNQSEIYNTVLSVYSHEDDRPLPQSDEVLLCTSHTTLDMVEIFWRRALYADSNKIYCLVNADLLDYDVSDKGEKSLERHMKYAESKGRQYRLVVICSSENEYKSRIVAALDKYHRSHLISDVSTVRKYLLTKLVFNKSSTCVRPASDVDFERCSVRIVKSWRAGVGKTLYKKRMVDELQKQLTSLIRTKTTDVTIPLHEKIIDIDNIVDVLLSETLPPRCVEPRIFHLDISHEVQEGVDALLFQLLVLGCLGHSSGQVWRRSELDYYIIESMPLLIRDSDTQGVQLKCLHRCLEILPHVMCRSPQESLDILNDKKPIDFMISDRQFDDVEFKSTTFQRPFQYLKRLDTNCRLNDVNPNVPEGNKKQCLDTLLKHCGIRDPSWSELHHFVSFLNKQLQDFEVSAFCSLAAVEDLPGFAKFVLRFLIQMSRDFSTRSLVVSEESPIQMVQKLVLNEEETKGDTVIQLYQMRRTWETSPHPYLFFNPDHHSMTFLGFNIERRTGNLVDQQTGKILENGIMQQNLFDALIRNKVNLAENFDALPRREKIMKLCNVMGLGAICDPDESYELTTDNVKKILAIYMRFRCQIPVIIMGETGCGKTRLIKFMCELQKPPGATVENMILMKVHGGTKAADIIRKVRKAEDLAKVNSAQFANMDTVLFFDEANTTEAIGVIKEIMCDKSLGGKPIQLHERLKIVAACNPYRKHSEELIKRLEQAGLGYHVDADKTSDKLGRVPMRRLVYRVQPLPQSMLPLVWDFGQLDTNVEEMYIRQMVLRYIKNDHLPNLPGLDTTVSKILTVSQDFMREQKDECSFVSLRDVERVLKVMSWFYRQSEDSHILFRKMREDSSDDSETESEDEVMEEDPTKMHVDDVTTSLVLALGVCYHACLKNRKQYRDTVAKFFTPPLKIAGGADQIEHIISRCQSVILECVNLAPNIAKNQALKENVFMMIVCIELRIPMFLVGKPGSSKSLAKTIVADAMQGNAAQNDLFKNYKQVQMVSFQCSPLSVPEGIVGTFRQCAAYQKDKNLDRFVSIVVLDEIGLAEDSPRMPLKTLHPLLEDGCPDDEEPEKYKKVAFIGISNWALDPAKMNRGILVQREVPNVTELIESAEGICSTSRRVLKSIKPMIPIMAECYLDLFKEASEERREFFGLRDFYSLLKMLYAFVSNTKKKPTWLQLKHAILRNFGGLEKVDPVDVFGRKLSHVVDQNEQPKEDDPDCTSAGMIQACLTGDVKFNSETRYLLLLTENYGALTILQQKIFTMENAVVIFGSSFPSDQKYTQVCRNINRIKVCMETGSTVILLNLENLYESLYDALNQYYVYFGGERYVDLGLGTHRVKCRVHPKFRLIVVAEKQIVYDEFPTPLINRLEKHFLSLKTMLTKDQLALADKLQEWAQHFCENKAPDYMRELQQKKDVCKIGDAFMGYHDDTCAAIILHVCQEIGCNDQNIAKFVEEIFKQAQTVLLWCATPAAVVQLRSDSVFMTYFNEQHHESLADYLYYKVIDCKQRNIHAQITTHSKLLSTADIEILCRFIPIQRQNVTLLTLQSFDTEQQFSREIKSFFDRANTTDVISSSSDLLLVVQCDCGDQNADLIACARYTVQRELQHLKENEISKIHVVFLIQLPRIAGGCFTGFQCGVWHSVHVDDIHPAPEDIPSVAEMHGKSVSALLGSIEERPELDMEIEEGKNGPENEIMETNEGEVDLMDIEIEEKRPIKTRRLTKQLTIDYLIKKCIQPALGNVKDPESDSSRSIERLKIIHSCLQNQQGDVTLMSGIANHLSSILKEKEQTFGQVITNWLSTEASKPENVNRAGTFRKFAVQCLESKVIPILAGIVAFIDTNRNLDILTNRNLEDWQVNLWLQIINNPDLTQLKYFLMVSPSRKELQEVAVKTTSIDGNAFSAAMPFSWLIYGQIDEVLRSTLGKREIEDSNFDLVMKASDIFQSLPLGRLLSIVEGTRIHEILKSYIQDFVHFVYPVQTEAECNLVCEAIMMECRQLIKGEFGRLIPSLLGFHMTFILHEARFNNFSHIVHVWPHCGQKTVEFKQNNSHFYLNTEDEITLDVLALHLLMEHLEPSRDGLNKPETRTKWLRQVCDYRPVIERIFGHFNQATESNEFHYGKICQKGIQDARYQWTRAVVVKLFIEHVCISAKDDIDIKRCMPLWGTLREGADMKDAKSLDKVEKFLKHCNKDVVTQCFGQQTTCMSCENIIQGASVRIPCDHVFCRKCFDACIALKEFECPNCQKEFPKDLDPSKSHKMSEIQKYQDYRTRCNSFFMEVVTQLCFAEGTPPSPQVIEKLFSYITGHSKTKRVERVVSKELTIFDDSIDPTPVVRSFLLQQLMQTSGPEIKIHLSAYFTKASDLVKSTGDPGQLVELCLLVLQCMEDSLHQQYSNSNDEIKTATKLLREAASDITSESYVLDKIDHISRVRFSLTVVAKYMYKLYGTNQKLIIDPSVRRLLEEAAKLCAECNSPWPRRFLVKQLCRGYGTDTYQTVVIKSDANFLGWMRLPERKEDKVDECHDRYIVNGVEYKELRETIVATALDTNSEKLEKMLQKPINEWQTKMKLLLALHREVTMNNLYGGDHQKFTDKGKTFLNNFVLNHALTANKEMTQRILENRIWKLQGNIIPKMDLAHQNIFCLLTHYLVLMTEIPGKTTLLTPLRKIALEPQSMMECFFPTMPQDETQVVKKAIEAAKAQFGDTEVVFYRCPNGHPYYIGNCGKAYVEQKCWECGMAIGGANHILRADNVKDQGFDRPDTGHIIGRADKLRTITAPERKLNRASFAVLRLLTHLSMYIGANINEQAVCQSIKPNIDPTTVGQYILDHIALDVVSIQDVLGLNKDDVYLLLHCLLAQIMNGHTMAVIGENQSPDVCGLRSRDSRAKWEADFDHRYILPIVKEKDNILTECNKQIRNDRRTGSDPLLQVLYEMDEQQGTDDILKLHDVPAVWRFRALITINHLRQNINTCNKKVPVLQLFLKEEHHLRAIRFVPSIIRLQKMLIQKYGRKLDRAEATYIKIQNVKEDMEQERRLKEFEHLLEDYIEAWNCVRESLEFKMYPANDSYVTIDGEYCKMDITDQTPVSCLLPTHRDAGLCSYVLLFFLMEKQNLFLQNYCIQCKIKEASLPKVRVKDISSAHLISYHPDRDLLPMVLANCNYSFEVGQGTSVEYNVTNLERQLMDRFLFSKSIITGISQIETMTYRLESTNAMVFQSLCERVKQEKLNPAVQSQIFAELRNKSYPDLRESLDKLDIAISFLKSVGSDPDTSLHDFMTNTLKMDNSFPSPKAQQASRCKHTMSMWITISMEMAKFLARYDKKAFEGISDNFKKPLTEDQVQIIENILNKLPVEQIDILVELIFECIVLRLDVPQNVYDEDYVDMSKLSLHDSLQGYISTYPFEGEVILDDMLTKAIGQIPSNVDDKQRILTGQSVDVWHLVNKIFTEKQRQRH